MKTNHYAAPLIAITVTFLTQPMRAQSPSIIMTENSSSVLDVIFNGTDITTTGVVNNSADHWTITLPSAVNAFPNDGWAEPENPTLNPASPSGWNQVNWISPTQLSVVSDANLLPSGSGFANGSQQTINGVKLQFNDASDNPPPNFLILEENSPTSLTASYTGPAGGAVVTPSGSDSWTITVPNAQLMSTVFTTWSEPGNSSVLNSAFSSAVANAIFVSSDVLGSGTLPDDVAGPTIGTDKSNFLPIQIIFDDDAATAETPTAPDSGSTLGLLALALAALFGASRLRSIRLA